MRDNPTVLHNRYFIHIIWQWIYGGTINLFFNGGTKDKSRLGLASGKGWGTEENKAMSL